MKTLNNLEIAAVSGAVSVNWASKNATAAVVAGALTTIVGWMGVVTYKERSEQLTKASNYGIVGGLGATTGYVAYVASQLV